MNRIYCFGYIEGELLPPYPKDLSNESRDSIKRVLNFLNLNPKVKKVKSLDNFYRSLRYFMKTKNSIDVEVMGAWGEVCIPVAVAHSIYSGLNCSLNLDLIVFRGEDMDDLKGRVDNALFMINKLRYKEGFKKYELIKNLDDNLFFYPLKSSN